MTFDESLIEQSFQFSENQINDIKLKWRETMELLLWGDVSAKKIGALPRSRKRMLEVGESLASFISSKSWIEQPRQQLKSALGSSVKLRDSLSALKLVSKHLLEGEQAATYQLHVEQLEKLIMDLILFHEAKWAEILDNHSD